MSKNKKAILTNFGFALAAAALIILVWQVSALILGKPRLLPPPIAALKSAKGIIKSGDFWLRLLFSTTRAAVAFLASIVLATILSLIMLKPWLRKIITPIITIMRALPTLAMVTLLWILTSANAAPVIICMLVLLPSLNSTFYSALTLVPTEITQTAKVFGAGRIKTARYVYLPHLLPVMIESTASGISLSLKLVISAEIIAHTSNSIGMMMQNSQTALLDMAGMFVTAVLVAFLCVILELLLRLPLKNFDYL